MSNLKKILIVLALLLIIGCTEKSLDFEHGLGLINEIDLKFGTNLQTFPKDIKNLDTMADNLKSLKKIKLDSGQEPFEMIVDFKLLNLQAGKLFIQGNKYGSTGYTKDGFACKPRPLIIESASLRRESANTGYAAVGLGWDILSEFPNEAELAGLNQRDIVFLNGTFFRFYEEASKDISTINPRCPESKSLEFYKQEFRKKLNFSEEYINELSYEKAVPIWKELNNIE
jgi:hypothetical protein